MTENFLAAGFHEIGRKFERIRLRRDVRTRDVERSAALVALAQRACDERLDISAYRELKERLSALDARAGDLSQTRGKLEADLAALVAERHTEQAKFDSRRQPIASAKSEADAALGTRRSARVQCEQAIRTAESRVAAIGAALQRTDADTAALTAEQLALRATVEQARTELPAHTADEARLQATATQRVTELAAVDAEQKATMTRLDQASRQVRSALAATTHESGTVQLERSRALAELGQKLFDDGVQPPALAELRARIVAIDEARAQAQSANEGSLHFTNAMPRHTMLKFWTVVVVLPLLLIATITVVPRYRASRAAAIDAASMTAVQALASEEDQKSEIVRRFIADRPGDSSEVHQRAVTILEEDIRSLGSTADRAYLPDLLLILQSDAPRLRAAAADAIGMIGPTARETKALSRLQDDKVPDVAQAARNALSLSSDPAARVLSAR